MTKTQLEITIAMMDIAIDYLSDSGCNDYYLMNTPDYLEFVKQMIADSDYPSDEPNLSKDQSKIFTTDWLVMRFCQRLLEKQLQEIE